MFYFTYDRICEVEVLVGCFILARRDAVDQFGLLDESFWMYGEDLDWSRRCWQAGWKVMFYPNAEAIHYCGGSSGNDPTRFAVAQLEARLQLWAKHHSSLRQQGFMVLIFIQCCLRLLTASFKFLVKRRAKGNAAGQIRIQVSCIRTLVRKIF